MFIAGALLTKFYLHKQFSLYRYQSLTLAFAFTLTMPAGALAIDLPSVVNLADNKVTAVSFTRITPNIINIDNNILTINVDKSASFLLFPFKVVTEIKNISFQWKKMGTINIKNAHHEKTRQGDDAYLRVGLILEGQPTLINPLAPKWVRTVKNTLYHPSDKMIYFVPGSQHRTGQRWTSPYSNDVEIIAIGSRAAPNGWNISEYSLEDRQLIVGLWIMADGDNTQSTFTSMLKELTIN